MYALLVTESVCKSHLVQRYRLKSSYTIAHFERKRSRLLFLLIVSRQEVKSWADISRRCHSRAVC